MLRVIRVIRIQTWNVYRIFKTRLQLYIDCLVYNVVSIMDLPAKLSWKVQNMLVRKLQSAYSLQCAGKLEEVCHYVVVSCPCPP